MEYTKLGGSDLTVSRLCLGCMSLGDASKGMHTWAVPYEEPKEIIGYAYENGINFSIRRWDIRRVPENSFLAGR